MYQKIIHSVKYVATLHVSESDTQHRIYGSKGGAKFEAMCESAFAPKRKQEQCRATLVLYQDGRLTSIIIVFFVVVWILLNAKSKQRQSWYKI